MKFLAQHHFYVNNMCAKSQGQKIHKKIDIQNLPTCVVVKINSLLPTLTPSQGLTKKSFAMTFLAGDNLYVDNMCSKFQVQEIYTKKDIRNLPTHVVLRKFSLLPTLTPSQGLKNCFFSTKFFP